MNITDEFINRIQEISTKDISERTSHTVKRCLIDYFGVVLSGIRVIEDREDLSIIQEGKTPVFGTEIRTDILSAALLNGFSAHVWELDDGHRYGMVHVGATIITAVLLVAHNYGIFDSDRIIRSIVCGYEVTIALAKEIQPEHKLNGYHASSTCGTLGASMAIGTLLQYDRNELKRTMTMSASSAAGLLNLMDEKSELKPYNIGRAAMDGIASAIMGRIHLNALDDPIGGQRGFIEVLSGKKIEKMSFEPNYLIMGVYTKMYASCRHCHPAVECALRLRAQMEYSEKNISTIRIKTYKLAIRGHDHITITSTQSAMMSIPYSFAVALLYGKTGIDAFSDSNISDSEIGKLMQKIVVEECDLYTISCPQKRIAEVVIQFADESVLSEKVDYPLGEPENPMTDAQIEEKCKMLMNYAGIENEKANHIIRSVWSMENNIDEMFACVLDIC
ncbi:MAG: MmgE/PrpD family protein [Lachnospiraceae bacterium]|nr:MmgE/PrpD family protein [Lachnospiraceae bacterium]